MESLGVAVELEAESLGRLCDDVGIAFLFAPRLHPAMKAVMPVRRALAVRTAAYGVAARVLWRRLALCPVFAGRYGSDPAAERLAELGKEPMWMPRLSSA